MLLNGKVVIISGVGPGMGQALARIAASEGASVILAARNHKFLEEVRDDIVANGGKAVAIPCDIADEAQCGALAEKAAAEFGGRIDGLVNSAYYHGDWSVIENADPADMATAFDVNCLGTLRLTRACIPYLRDGGAVVNVSTMATVRPFGGEHGMEMGYAVAKGAVNTLTKYMAADLGRYGIRVNACRMGWIHGAPVEGHIQAQVDAGLAREDVLAGITRDIPIGKIPPEDDCARAVLMMISDFTRVVTGASLDVNGGHWMAP
ncbi:NAD(P)-dependent dehydrogenase (short-subunit alcohol dehydrogenase family) [Sphingobium sp. OAS761]|uniref:SDR family oxidoreductase n=1 Tax=Sphingobium sp. OAS761 TaxID=2817901 RepID=UPI00209CC995|nr:SDR family oxidoreductase [Sphingobium sp. OAS761]MCP1470381.1 NAD(P)-dependent dehydrogenase (short-subunit alcohol dehydrogenase family) [Sphingobium sp. OAS761]